MKKATYKDSGVDLEVYAESMSRLPKLVQKTFSPNVLRLDGGFAGLFQLNGKQAEYKDPVLVSCTDGVGTKLKVACLCKQHGTVGIDLVAMSVNDAICCGARPLFFLDYVAMPKDDPDRLEELVQGITAGCLESDCALIGGETAILGDLYQPGEYDLAGFCVGVAERDQIINGNAIEDGDLLIGIASSGFHSNGYSLIRKVVFDLAGLSVETMVPECGQTVGELLMTPTRLYVRPVMDLIENLGANIGLHGIAHITGGGLVENLSRILPKGVVAEVNEQAWPLPERFQWLQRLGDIEEDEMRRVFNCGIGMVLVVRPDQTEVVKKVLQKWDLAHWTIGSIRHE